MTSLRTLVSPNRRAAARFVGQTRRRLQQALDARPHVKRTNIADALGVHRSVITKHFNGTQDMTLGRAAELAWALGYQADFVLRDLDAGGMQNEDVPPCPAFENVLVISEHDSLIGEIYTDEYEFA